MLDISRLTHRRSALRPPSSELERLDAHFVNVLESLERRPPRRLSGAQKRARALNLARLQGYRRRALFPKNTRFPGRRLPHFVDDAGTRCAMGHLIEESGGRDLVQRIVRERNYARVRELADLPELVLWLEANGLTLDEAQRIQPEYCGPPAHNCLCGTGFGSGLLEGTLGDAGSSLTVTAVYGPVSGVKPGDVLAAVDSIGVGSPLDVVFATLGGDGKTAFLEFGSAHGEITIPTSACFFPQVASIPGPLPLATVEKALSASSESLCEGVLDAYDARWSVVQGGPNCTAGPGAGGAAASDGSVSGAAGSGASDASVGANASAAPGDRDGGCALSHHVPGAPAVGIALSAALVAYRLRRAERRR